MNFSEVSVRRPVTVGIIAVLLTGIALFMVPDIAVEMFPSVSSPMVLVQTSYIGASPLEVEQGVSKRLEKQLANVSGVKKITSTSSAGSSTVVMEFGYDKNLDEAVNDIRDSLDVVKNRLPDETSSPVIIQLDMNAEAIMHLIMQGDETPNKLKSLAEDVVQPRMERIEGVASADVTGGETRAIRVDVSLNRLEAYGITSAQVTSALSSQNLQMSGGNLSVDNTQYDLKIDERYTSLEEISRTVVATLKTPLSSGSSVNRSSIVRLRDIANVYEGAEDTTSLFYVNGKPAISVEVTNESDTNTIQVASAIKAAIPEINAKLPNGISISVLYDDTTMIDSVMNQVYKSAWQGILLAMLILFLFLRSWRSTLIIGLSIPISIVVTLMFMYFFNITLNMMSLTGLILGLGMIVDNSIVILENIHQYRERGTKLKASAVLGSQEMINAITASTLTTLCVFLPIIIWQDGLEMIGEVFSDMVFTVMISLVISYITAIALVPALSSHFIKLYTHSQRPIKNRILKAMDGFGVSITEGVERGYRRSLKFVLSNRLMVLTLVIVILAVSATSLTTLGISLLPRQGSDDQVTIRFSMPMGTELQRTEEVMLQFKDIIESEIDGYEHLVMSVGGSGGSFSGKIKLNMPSLEKQTIRPSEIQNILRPFTASFPDTDISFSSGGRFGASSPIDIIVYSNDLDMAVDTATNIRNLLKNRIPEIVDPVTDLDDGTPEYKVEIDKDRAAAYGLKIDTVAMTINGLVNGSTPTTYWDNVEELDVIVQLAESDRDGLPDLDSIYIPTQNGQKIALSNLASYTLGTGPQNITREDEVRTIHVTADLVPNVASNQIQPAITALLQEELFLPEGVTYEFAGDGIDIQAIIPTFITVIIVAFLMIFAVMAAQFESLADPFIIFFSIPLLLIGVVLIYQITGAVFNMFSMIGMIVLMGIVVNNGIVMVDYINLLRKRNSKLLDAVLDGAVSRLRPVLMTSLTTILSMVPMAFFPGEGTEMIRPIGQTIVGGLASSTFITMFVTPAIYTLVNKDKKKKRIEENLKPNTEMVNANQETSA